MMTLSFPEWVPLWGQLLALAVGIVFGLAFMMMPFAVFGVKSRLSELSLQLEELQAELRARAMQGNGFPPDMPLARRKVRFPLLPGVRMLPWWRRYAPPWRKKTSHLAAPPFLRNCVRQGSRMLTSHGWMHHPLRTLNLIPTKLLQPDVCHGTRNSPPRQKAGPKFCAARERLMPIRLHTGLIFHTSSHPHALPCPKHVMTRIQAGLNLCCIFHPATGRKLLRGQSGF